jgi:RIO-like serine/threonine protein kinase
MLCWAWQASWRATKKEQALKYESKNNDVFLQDGQVHKISSTAQQEASILCMLHSAGVPVPRVIAVQDNLLVLECLPDQPLPDVIECGEYQPEQLAQALCTWFEAFARACPDVSRGDVNGRNFLYDGTQIYAVDFEQPLQSGSLSCDCGRLAAFLATYRTAYPEKQAELVHAFMQRSGYPVHAFLVELVAMKQRRA